MIAAVLETREDIIDFTAQQMKAHPEEFLGPWLLSIVALTFMMGVLATQSARYFSTFGYESSRLFFLVVSCVLLAVAEWVVLLMIEWNRCITNYGNWSKFLQTSRGSVALSITTWLTVFTAQLFFASRCYTLYGRNKLIFGALLFGMTTSLILFVSRGILTGVYRNKPYILTVLSFSGLAINVATDVAITVLTLWKIGRGGTTYSPKTQRALQRLRNIVIEAAVPPTIGVVLNISACKTMDDRNSVSRFFAAITPMLYVLSLMFTLNSRVAISQTFNAPSHKDDEQLSTGFQFANSQALDQKFPSVDTESTAVGLTTVPEQV